MKVLIVAQSRSGSSFLAKDIAKKLNLKLFWEPFNEKNNPNATYREQVDFIKKTDNLLVKVVDNQFNKVGIFKNNPEKFFNMFDKVIGLTRSNDIKCGISRYFAIKSDYWKDGNTKKESKKLKNVDKVLLNNCISFATKRRKEIENFNIFQVTYEDIYFYNKISLVWGYLDK